MYWQYKSTRLWYRKLKGCLLDLVFVVSNVYPCLFMSEPIVFVVYVDECLFWGRSQSKIYIVMNYLKEDGTIYNW